MVSTPQALELIPLTSLDLVVNINDEHITLPDQLRAAVDTHWQSVVEARPNLYNGPVYTVVDIARSAGSMTVTMSETDFAHHEYSQAYDAGEHAFRVLHSAAWVMTSDNYVVLGQMAEHTARSGAICSSGGAIDPKDIHNGVVDLAGSTIRELHEEMGIDASNPQHVRSFAPYYLKVGGPSGKIAALYRVDLALDSTALQKHYAGYVAQLTASGEAPEFSRLWLAENTPEAVEAFIQTHGDHLDEYVTPVLRASAAQ